MIRMAMILVAPALLHAQSPLVKRGAEIFRTTCGVAYCHGAEGAAGRAPQLVGRGFNPRDLFNVIRSGRPGTGMPGFSQQLKSEDLEAVIHSVTFGSRRSGGRLPEAHRHGTAARGPEGPSAVLRCRAHERLREAS
jgi:mono/diheme cytochrome c family protein